MAFLSNAMVNMANQAFPQGTGRGFTVLDRPATPTASSGIASLLGRTLSPGLSPIGPASDVPTSAGGAAPNTGAGAGATLGNLKMALGRMVPTGGAGAAPVVPPQVGSVLPSLGAGLGMFGGANRPNPSIMSQGSTTPAGPPTGLLAALQGALGGLGSNVALSPRPGIAMATPPGVVPTSAAMGSTTPLGNTTGLGLAGLLALLRGAPRAGMTAGT